MKKTFLSLAFCGAMVVGKAQTADEVVNKHIEAMGGKDKLLTLKTLVREGVLNSIGVEIPITLTSEQDKGFKMEVNVMGTIGYEIITPTGGWIYMPFQGSTGLEYMTEEQVKQGQDDLDVQGELLDYAAKGHKVELLGKEKLDGVEVYKLKLTSRSGMVKDLYIDASTSYVVKVVVTEKDKTSEVRYSNYKKTPEGFLFAYTLVRPEGEVRFSKISTNTKLPDSTFKPEN
ncbi:MAG: hypothetical protein JNM22_09200 [Saprospiraceae bacterium]|nr:hypothetical protein [Saprospiraceae bacterium]